MKGISEKAEWPPEWNFSQIPTGDAAASKVNATASKLNATASVFIPTTSTNTATNTTTISSQQQTQQVQQQAVLQQIPSVNNVNLNNNMNMNQQQQIQSQLIKIQPMMDQSSIATITATNAATDISSNSAQPPASNSIHPETPTLIDLLDSIYFSAKTKLGSEFIRQNLSYEPYFPFFFKGLKCHVTELMGNKHGHYVIRDLFIHSDDHQRLILVANLSNDMPRLACHRQGSFSIQTMMDTLSTTEQLEYLEYSLNLDIKKIISKRSGHFVILKFLQRYDYPHSKFIHKALIQHTLDLATGYYGSRVMKASIDAGPIQEMSAVFAAIVKHTNALVQNEYGNHIIQHLLDVGPIEVTDAIKEEMHGKFVRYSTQKFSSNVVDKCLRHSANEFKQGIHTKVWTKIIVRELLTEAGDLIHDEYGNYCLQTALQASKVHYPCLLQKFKQYRKLPWPWNKLFESAEGSNSGYFENNEMSRNGSTYGEKAESLSGIMFTLGAVKSPGIFWDAVMRKYEMNTMRMSENGNNMVSGGGDDCENNQDGYNNC